MPNNNDLDVFFKLIQSQVNQYLESQLPSASSLPCKLPEAMRYSSIDGGKRIRPVLTCATADIFGLPFDAALPVAASVELIHAYSLVHDDLPAMDDDDLRRGKPTCHIAFDEATAILVGDALQTLAFEWLSNCHQFSPDIRLQLIRQLASASGPQGMVAGQAIDLASVGKQLTLAELENMHRYKTGALIEASVTMGAIAAGVSDQNTLGALKEYARAIGLAFQVQDDILDIVSDTATLGKTQGADIDRNKPTYPALLGLDGAIKKARELHQQALASLDLIQGDCRRLAQISAFIVERLH